MEEKKGMITYTCSKCGFVFKKDESVKDIMCTACGYIMEKFSCVFKHKGSFRYKVAENQEISRRHPSAGVKQILNGGEK